MWQPMAKLTLIAGILYMLAAPLTMASEVGKSVFVRGVATAQSESGEGRILGKDSPLFEGDTITTGSRTFAIIGLNDGTRMTLKPNTVFKIEEMTYDAHAAAENAPQTSQASRSESLFVRLFRGGLRAITGLVAKRNDNGFRVATPVATIGVRGTDFEARLCEDDCQEEARSIRRVSAAQGSPVVARVAFLTGSLTATGFDGRVRRMSLGGSLLAGDILQTAAASVTVIVFRDESRVTLRANSRFRIESYNYQPESPDENSTLMRLIEGSIRVVSGLIAKTKPKAHKVVTPVATMSVRGTGFDIRCRGKRKNGRATNAEAGAFVHAMTGLIGQVMRSANAQNEDGCDIWVWEGAIVLQIDSRTFVIPEGKAYFVSGTGDLVPYREVPPSLKNQESPDPDPSVMDKIAFDMTTQEQPEFGLYVQVSSGDVVVTDLLGNSRVAGYGEVLFVDVGGGGVQRLRKQPRLIGIPDPTLFDDSVTQEIMLLNPSADVPQSSFECVIG